MSEAQTKTILVLANSIKKYPSRCVAGIEMMRVEGGYNFGSWIRPVDPSQNEGALPLSRTVVNNQPVEPLQVVKMIFAGPSNDPNHPEDWNLQPNTQWEFLGQYDNSILAKLPDQTGDLWGAGSIAKKRIPTGTANNTLRLIKPKGNVYVEAFHETDWYTQKDKFRKVLTIPCQCVHHSFSITDPRFEERHGLLPGKVKKDERLKFELKPEGLFVIASLTPPLGGYQYKIAATIIEP
jgi:hypothetical protein